MDCLWIKRGNSLCPSDIVTADLLATFANGERLRTDAPRCPRNPEFHRLMMAGLWELVQNTHPRFADVDAAMDYLKLKSGMVEWITFPGMLPVLKFKSVSFAAMDQTKFKAVAEQWRAIALEEFGIDLLEERIDEAS